MFFSVIAIVWDKNLIKNYTIYNITHENKLYIKRFYLLKQKYFIKVLPFTNKYV